ncbi:MAG: DUF4375 domain-containing protein [Burkholderiales bacterium]|jgi:hypothetical protein|nr:DUF4375 domain-containing protein [Burkholderiales bacterium]
MMDKLPCRVCGKPILPSTSEKTGGMCMPCKGGYRKRMEESARWNEEEKQRRASPQWKHWLSLVDRVHKTSDGFSGLSSQEQKFFASRVLVQEIYNGGFDQYFFNSSGDYYAITVAVLAEIGATESLRTLLQAKTAIFGEMAVPASQDGRLPILQSLSREIDSRLDLLDKEFCDDADGIDDRIERYAIENHLRDTT